MPDSLSQWAILSLLEDLSGEFAAAPEPDGTGHDRPRDRRGAEPTIEHVRYLLDLSNNFRDMAHLLDATVAGVAETILDRSTGKEMATILDSRIAGTSTEATEATDAVQEKAGRSPARNKEGEIVRGHIRQRGNGLVVVIDHGRDEAGRRKQKWYSGYKTRKEAEQALTKMLAAKDNGEQPEEAPTKLTYGTYALKKVWLPALAGPSPDRQV